MIDPLERWREYGEKPDFAGPVSYGGAPYTQDPACSPASTSRSSARRPTISSPTARARASRRARSAPASCPPGPHLEAKIDAFAVLRIVDYGDAPVLPADPGAVARGDRGDGRRGRSTQGSSRSCSAATTRSPSPTSARARRRTGRSGSSTSTRTRTRAREVFGVEVSHGTPMYRLVRDGHVDPKPLRADRAARLLARRAGVRLAGGAGHHVASSCTTCASSASRRSCTERCRSSATGRSSSRSTSTCSTRVRAGHRHAGAGRHDERRAAAGRCALFAERLELVGADVVEVIPTAVGSADVTALVADRIVRETLTGIALRRRLH